MNICDYCGMEGDDLEKKDDGEGVCMDCLYMYDRERYNEVTGREDDD